MIFSTDQSVSCMIPGFSGSIMRTVITIGCVSDAFQTSSYRQHGHWQDQGKRKRHSIIKNDAPPEERAGLGKLDRYCS